MADEIGFRRGFEWRISFRDSSRRISFRDPTPATGAVMGLTSIFSVFLKEALQLAKMEPEKLVYGLKVGLALSLVSLFYYLRPLYEGVGGNAMWAVLTVVAVFEYTVGETLLKCVDKVGGTILAGGLGICLYWVASQLRGAYELVILQGSVCLITALATFSRFIPCTRSHFDYGAIIFILTFTMISLSGYREEKPYGLALHRLSTITIGTSICILTSLLFRPVWAGNELHDLVKSNMEELAGSLDGCVAKYLTTDTDAGGDHPKSETSNDVSIGCNSVLESRATEESLAHFTKWEPGGFRFRHPWKEYLEVGDSLRSCAYCVEVLNRVTDSTAQAQDVPNKELSEFCLKLSSNATVVLKELVVILDTMTKSDNIGSNVLEMCNAVQELQNALKTFSKEPMPPTVLTHDGDNEETEANKEETEENKEANTTIPLVMLSSLLIEIAGITETMAKTVDGFADKPK